MARYEIPPEIIEKMYMLSDIQGGKSGCGEVRRGTEAAAEQY